MAEQYEMTVLPNNTGDKLLVVQTDTVLAPDDDAIICVIGATVNLNRHNEILNGLRTLATHMRDNNQLSATGASIYTFADIDSVNNITQTVNILDVSANDILIGVGTTIVTSNDGSTNIIDNAFNMLIDWMRESGLVATP